MYLFRIKTKILNGRDRKIYHWSLRKEAILESAMM